MWKRTGAILLSLTLLLGLCVPAAAAAGQTGKFIVSEASGRAGDQVQVTVSVADNPGLICTALKIHYDTDTLKLVDVEDGKLLGSPMFSQSYSSFPYRVSWNDALAEDTTEDGVLVTLTFEILDAAQAGKTAVTVTYHSGDIFDQDLEVQPFTAVNGGVTVLTGSTTVGTGTEQPPVKTPAAAAALYRSYTDLQAGAWYQDTVTYMLQHGYMNGMTANTFAPNGSMTRAQLVTILYRAAGSPRVTGSRLPFTDVASGAWYHDAVRWAYASGVTGGVSDDRFGSGENITRQQLATLLYRWSGAAPTRRNHLAAFSDRMQISDYAKDAMNWAVGQGILNGSNGKLDPGGTATRAQAAAMIARYLKQSTAIPVPDVNVKQ